MGKKSKSKTNKPRKPKRNADELLTAAETEVDPQRQIAMYSTAARLLRAANQGSTKLANAMGRCAECKVSVGDEDGAKSKFLEGVSVLGFGNDVDLSTKIDNIVTANFEDISMASGFYLYLGQLSSAEEALAFYRKGLFILEKSCCKDDDQQAIEIRKQLCAANCSLADLFMTDLCYEPDAETECEAAINCALKNDDGVVADALQAMANLRLSQSRPGEAVPIILRAYERMHVGCSALATIVGLGVHDLKNDIADDDEAPAPELSNVDEANALPGFEFRCQTAKILLECAAHLSNTENLQKDTSKSNECAEAAVQVLASLLAQDDEVIEIWYLIGCAFNAFSPSDAEMAKHHWDRALEMLLKVRAGIEDEIKFGSTNDVLTEQMEEIKGQVEEVQEKLSSISTASADAMDEG